jgi:hypothetical protein
MKTLLALTVALSLLTATAHAQYYTSRGSLTSEPGDLMSRQPDGSTQNITQDDEDDARERARDEPRYSPPEPSWHTQSYPTDNRGSDDELRAGSKMLNEMSGR